MYKIFLISHRFHTFITPFSSSLACFQMYIVLINWYIKLTILTILRFPRTNFLMYLNFQIFKLFFTILACYSFMKLFLMLFFIINIIHFITLLTFLNISTTIAIMSSYFRLGKLFQAVITLLGRLGHRLYWIRLIIFRVYYIYYIQSQFYNYQRVIFYPKRITSFIKNSNSYRKYLQGQLYITSKI